MFEEEIVEKGRITERDCPHVSDYDMFLIMFDYDSDLDYDYVSSKTQHLPTFGFCGKPVIVLYVL